MIVMTCLPFFLFRFWWSLRLASYFVGDFHSAVGDLFGQGSQESLLALNRVCQHQTLKVEN